jgi:cytoskeletal protein CcmA (bactofilin family)
MSNSFISEDLVITGNIKSASGIEIKGSVIGDIEAISVEIGTSGSVDGNVSAKSADIHGSMKGGLSTVSVTIHSKAVVKANITAEEMASENGARIAGKIDITGAKGG